MLKIGITGQAGFIGTHLFNTLGLHSDAFLRIPFDDAYFQDTQMLEHFVSQCDVIVHLAAMNRGSDPELIYQTNIALVNQLISACEKNKVAPHILFSSSTQEEGDNLYGRSKREGRKLLEQWAANNNAFFSGLIIPNVYGSFGQPYYNSVVATFCHQLVHNETPTIDVDGELKLIYVGDLVTNILERILTRARSIGLANEIAAPPAGADSGNSIETILIPHSVTIKVSALLQILAGFKESYFENAILPNLTDAFTRNLFNTFVCYIDHKSFFPFKLKRNTDERGAFVETVKLNSGGQVSFSSTVPEITRGNHFHIRKAERFAVIKGKARIDIRRIGTDDVLSFELDGTQPSFVDMPIWFTHSITNIGTEELYTIFWISEHFNPGDPDTYFEKVQR